MKNSTEHAARLFCVCIYALLGYLAFKYLLPSALPLLVAVGVSAGISGVAEKLERGTGVSHSFWAFILVTCLLAVSASALFLAVRYLILEIRDALATLAAQGFSAFSPVFSLIEEIPALGELAGDSEKYFESQLAPLVTQALSSLGSTLASLLSSAVRSTPAALLSALVGVMCIYYMSMDFDGICAFFASLLPPSARDVGIRLKKRLSCGVLAFVKAYAKLFFLTFFELLAGLLVLCPRYALLGALAVSALDVLPVFGAGLVLLPWSVACFFAGETLRGVGFLILYLIITVVRRIVEPRVIGKQIGLHPLGALVAMYFGYRLFGVTGMLVAPIAVKLISWKENTEDSGGREGRGGRGRFLKKAPQKLPEK